MTEWLKELYAAVSKEQDWGVGRLGEMDRGFSLQAMNAVLLGLHIKHMHYFIKLNKQPIKSYLEHHGDFLRKGNNYKGK